MQALSYLKSLNSAKPNLARDWRTRISVAGKHGLTFLYTVCWHKELKSYFSWPMKNWTLNSEIRRTLLQRLCSNNSQKLFKLTFCWQFKQMLLHHIPLNSHTWESTWALDSTEYPFWGSADAEQLEGSCNTGANQLRVVCSLIRCHTYGEETA